MFIFYSQGTGGLYKRSRPEKGCVWRFGGGRLKSNGCCTKIWQETALEEKIHACKWKNIWLRKNWSSGIWTDIEATIFKCFYSIEHNKELDGALQSAEVCEIQRGERMLRVPDVQHLIRNVHLVPSLLSLISKLSAKEGPQGTLFSDQIN